MKKTIFQILKIAGFMGLGVLLLFLAFRGIRMDQLAETLKEVNFGWIGLSVSIGFLSYLPRARRWKLLIEPLGYQPSLMNTYHSLMVGYLSNYALPRLGELTRCVTLGKREKIPVDALIGTVIMERIIDLVMLFLIMLTLLIIWMEKFGAFFSEQVFIPLRQKMVETFGGTWVFWLITAATLFLLAALVFLFRKRLSRLPLIRRIRDIIRGILEGLITIRKMNRKWEFIMHSLLIWLLYILMTWVVVFALKETSGLTFVDGMFLLVAGGLGMAAPVTAGFGAFHWIISRAMVVVYGFSLEIGGAFAILAHESNSLLVITLGAISYLWLMLSRKKEAKPDQ